MSCNNFVFIDVSFVHGCLCCIFFFFQAEDGIRDADVTGVQTCALPILELEDLEAYKHHGPLMAMAFQAEVEKQAWLAGGQSQIAPAQRMVDFVQGKRSESLLESSYQPGLRSVEMKEVLPDFIAVRLQDAFKAFDKKMKGYYTNQAQIVGVESRTSSPVRVPRDRESFEHIATKRLYPCGEGAGYAGGIVSAAMDGERCAEKLIEKYG